MLQFSHAEFRMRTVKLPCLLIDKAMRDKERGNIRIQAQRSVPLGYAIGETFGSM